MHTRQPSCRSAVARSAAAAKRLLAPMLAIVCALVLSGCFGSVSRYYGGFFSAPKASFGQAKPSTPATMRPYTVHGKRYYPARVGIGDMQTGIASWYGPGFHGKLTSNGERFDTHSFTAAHKTMPMNTIVRVDNLENGRSVTVRINDRGPFVAGRIIDLSNAAAHAIDMTKKGTARVRLSVVGFADGKSASGSYVAKSPRAGSSPASGEFGGEFGGGGTSGGRAELKTVAKVAAAAVAAEAVKEIVGGDFLLQIGAFKSEENAKKFAASKVKSLVRRSSDGLFRVFLRGFKSESEARDFAAAARLIGALVVRDD